MADETASLELRLLGPTQVRAGGVIMAAGRGGTLRTVHDLWLLALLVLETEPGGVGREWLAETLWPGSAHGPQYVNQAVVRLRPALGPHAGRLQNAGRGRLRLDLGGVESDVAAFRRLASAQDPGPLEEAVTLYRGPLLEGCSELWVLPYRIPLADAYRDALLRLAAHARAGGDHARSAEWLRRAWASRPDDEGTLRALMQALADSLQYAEMERLHRSARGSDAETAALSRLLSRRGKRLARETGEPLAD